MGNEIGSSKNTGNKARPRKTSLLLIKLVDLVMKEEQKEALVLNFLLPQPLQVSSALSTLVTVLNSSFRVWGREVLPARENQGREEDSYLIRLEIPSPQDCMGLKGIEKQHCFEAAIIFERLYLSVTTTIASTKGSLFSKGEGKGMSTKSKSQVQRSPV